MATSIHDPDPLHENSGCLGRKASVILVWQTIDGLPNLPTELCILTEFLLFVLHIMSL